MARYYITKYALSGGLSSMEAAPRDGYIYQSWTSFKVGRDAFLEKQEALADCEARRLKKIASLRKQIAKLEKLTF